MTHKVTPPLPPPRTTLDITDHSFMKSPPYIFKYSLLPRGTSELALRERKYHNLPYISSSYHGSPFQQSVLAELRHEI